MKIMLPVKNDKNGKNDIAKEFHNIDFVCVHDSHLKTTEWFSIKEISETAEGLNSGLIQKGIYSIISMNITPMVLTMFKRNRINVYKTQNSDVFKTLEMFQMNQLKSFTPEDSRQITTCKSKSCSSCGTTCN